MEGDPLPCIDAIQIHSEGVAYLLSNIYPGQSHGPDNLPVFILKEVSSEIAPAHTLIFQASLLNSLDQAEVWKQSIAIVILYSKRADTQTLVTIDLLYLPVYALNYIRTYCLLK